MPLPNESHPLRHSNTLARSRSRYKGHRSRKPAVTESRTTHREDTTGRASLGHAHDFCQSTEAREQPGVAQDQGHHRQSTAQRLPIIGPTGTPEIDLGCPQTTDPPRENKHLQKAQANLTCTEVEVHDDVYDDDRDKGLILAQRRHRRQGSKGQKSKPISAIESARPHIRPAVRASTNASTPNSSTLPTAGKINHLQGRWPMKRKKVPRIEQDQALTDKPAFDAPISAINAGERRVTVEYENNAVSVQVKSTTTTADVILSTTSQLGLSIDLDSVTLCESFRQLGLERPLRFYEHVRDVLNSWKNDAQNVLLLLPSDNAGIQHVLASSHVLRTEPVETSVQLYHSQRPGHWEKRLITLRADGQIMAVKKGSTSNICHLSDFDIYNPTRKQMSKTIKPPRKLCFAIKSQQKSTMFLSTENFVHFFSTKDKALASRWYSAVQVWRSWYLVNVLGEGQGNVFGTSAQTQSGQLGQLSQAKGTKLAEGHPFRAAQKSDSRQHGLKRISMGFKQAGRLSETCAQSCTEPVAAISNTSPGQLASPPTHPCHNTLQVCAPAMCGPGTVSTFSSNGLLGRTYTIRKTAQREREAQNTNDPIGASTLSHLQQNHGDHDQSARPVHRPLVDLTLSRQELSHPHRFQGDIPERFPRGGLVKAATTPEEYLPKPEHQAGLQRLETVRRLSPKSTIRQQSKSATSRPFSKGLLARYTSSQGESGHGRGLKTSDRDVQSPMIDLHAQSQYAPGSLLASVQQYEGDNGKPVIDRSRRREHNVVSGEGI